MTRSALLDAALVQIGWWACVLGAANGKYLLGPFVVALLIAVQAWRLDVDARRQVWRGVLWLGAAGIVIDSLHGAIGTLTFQGAPGGWIAPLWIIVLWCHLATALPALAALKSRPWIAGLLGAIGAPLAYAGGARLGAAALHPEPWLSLLTIAAVWAVALPLMLHFLVAKPEPKLVPSLEPARPAG